MLALATTAALLYFVRVPQNPPGYHIDESSVSYNAYTIARSGCDEFGNRWPLYFRAFGDYKNPVYIYLLAGLYALSGPSILVARLLSATAGVFAGIALGFLAKRITRSATAGLLTAITALLTPWLFEVSRVALEVALYPLVLTLFLVCVHRAGEKTSWSRLDAVAIALTLALVTYTYSIGRLLGPLLACGLGFFWNAQRWRSVVRVWFAYAATLVPIVIFSDKNPGALTQRFLVMTYIAPENGIAETALQFARHYISNLNVWRLLVRGDPNRDQVVHLFGTGHFLAAAFVLALLGMWRVWRTGMPQPWWRFVLYALLVSIIPASLTKEHFHMLRLIPVAVILMMFVAVGFAWFAEEAPTKSLRLAFVLLIAGATAQAAAFQWKFHHSAQSPRRVHLFDARYREKIFAPAVASGMAPIYIADVPEIPGYIQAYWYGTLANVDLSKFVRLPPDESPPAGALVISTEENCPGCKTIAKVKPYTLYVASEPRPRLPLPDEGFHALISPINAPTQLRAKQRATIRVRVKNTSNVTWLARERSRGKLQVSLGNHWLDHSGNTVISDDGRSALLQDLLPNSETELRLTINTPRKAGDYILELDMLQEGVSWFGGKGGHPERLPVTVR